jgi:hypothetical protein
MASSGIRWSVQMPQSVRKPTTRNTKNRFLLQYAMILEIIRVSFHIADCGFEVNIESSERRQQRL